MDKKNIFIQIDQMEEQMGALYTELGELRRHLIQLLEENKRLSTENKQLRKVLKEEMPLYTDDDQEPSQASDTQTKESSGEGHGNLARIYHEGFHVCNVYYGHLRTEGDCLFCLSFLNK